ncbi:unnamed protein product [Clonostachys rosea f. rosea IK726]|uniref:Uncharacterized protein n=2 Tax=Bionectria ochroleuca TaxID=29856 RepID=A0ACA9USC1_BIOOC|nr:unnamed protein product [Clonostachys rosea f. rosea IK726]
MKSTVLVLALASLAAASAELKIDVTRKVKCERKTQKGDQVKMHYHGSLESNGEKFDASYDRGQPLAFKLGTGQVIKGWDEGLLDMCIGEKRTLTIPPEFGYGSRGIGPIPGGATLIFKTELVGIAGVETPNPEDIIEVEEEKGEEKKEEAKESEAAKETEANVAEQVQSVASEAAEAIKTVVADTDDPVHGEL